MANERSRESRHDEVAGGQINDNDFDHVVQLNQKNLEILKSLREKIDWNVKKERLELIRHLYSLSIDWKGKVPDLRNIFKDKEIERLLLDSIQHTNISDHYVGEQIVRFVARSGYKNNPDLDKDGKPMSNYTTPIHYAVRSQIHSMDVICFLFEIYNRFDVNYTDEFGYTHFHVACDVDYYCIVKKFLENGQNPNLLVPKTGDSPLHLALDHELIEMAHLLLKYGANPNWVNNEGLTPVHVLCKTGEEWNNHIDAVKQFFKIIDETNQTVQIDARDNDGRTPIHYAVARFLPHTVDILLNRGADLSNFVFPTERDFDEYLEWYESISSALKLQVTSGLLAVIERLEKENYELDQSDVLTIIKFLVKHKLFQNLTDVDEKCNDYKELTKEEKIITISQNLSFYDFLQMQPEEVEKQLIYADHFAMVCSIKWCEEMHSDRERMYTAHLCKKLPTRFFRRWALYPFWELIRYRLPIECCEMTLEGLMHEDLCNIFLAHASQSS